MNGVSEYTKARFWSKIDVGGPADCWPWQAASHKFGYGRFRLDGQLVSPHRLAYEIIEGPLPAGGGYHGTVIRHRCNNPQCCNPAHLDTGTQKDNVQDMVQSQAKKWAKLTPEQILAIKDDPRSQREIGKDYGISKTHVGRIKNGQAWKAAAQDTPTDDH